MASRTSSEGERPNGPTRDLWGEMAAGSDGPDAGQSEVRERAAAAAPVIWLLGKVQSGKSSIVQAITGASEAEIGSGFRPCTKTARIFDFPVEAPLVRFLDTRGLGEAGYDPAEDMKVAEGQSHLLLVVMKVLDPGQTAVVEAVATVRRRHPDWPVVVAQTTLHDGYPAGEGHPGRYAFDATGKPTGAVPQDLSRALAYQRGLFGSLPGSGAVRFVPIDFVHEGDGLDPRHYGLEALLDAIQAAAPEGLAATLGEIERSKSDATLGELHPIVLAHAGVAAAVDLLPVAGAVAVPGVQARLLYLLAEKHGVAWDRRAFTEFGACLGAGVLTRVAAGYGIRQLAKLVPVYGQTVGAAAAAAASFATTYAIGRAAIVFLGQRRAGISDPVAVAQAYADALRRAPEFARGRTGNDGAPRVAPSGGAGGAS